MNIDDIIKNINDTFLPITEEIDKKVKYLQDIVGDTEEFKFKPISKDDLK